MRWGENATFDVAGTPLVVRVHRPGRPAEAVARELEVVGFLARRGVPVAPPAADILLANGIVVSLWKWVEHDRGATRDFEAFGRLIRRIHEASEGMPVELPKWSPWGKMQRRLQHNRHLLDDCDFGLLRTLIHEAEQEVERSSYTAGFVHGDAHYGNTLATPDGLVMVDFEEAAWGPRSWDLAPTAIAERRFGLSSKELKSFYEGYGVTAPGTPLFTALLSTRELTMTTWLLQLAQPGTQERLEFAKRMQALRGGVGTTWNAF